MSEALKPCPFCGHHRIDFIVAGWMRCRKCGTRGPIDTIDWPNDKIDAARTEAQRLWNRRTPATMPTVEELRELFWRQEGILFDPHHAIFLATITHEYLTRRMGGESTSETKSEEKTK